MADDSGPKTFEDARRAARLAVCKEIIGFGLADAEITMHMAHDIADAALTAAGVEAVLDPSFGHKGSES